jgi:hypothetical protein
MSRARVLVVGIGVLALSLAGAGTAATPHLVGPVSRVSAASLRYSYRAGCPVPPSQLRLLHLRYVGFDGVSHVGEIVVNAAVVGDVLAVFEKLYAERFPIRRMEPIDAFRGSDNASMAADNTSGFNCRYAVTTGPKAWSVHAYGEAIDVNPVENPYYEGGHVLPPAGAAYADRAHVRAGMAVPQGELNDAFAAVGWFWGGRWRGSPDYQHFSKTGG